MQDNQAQHLFAEAVAIEKITAMVAGAVNKIVENSGGEWPLEDGIIRRHLDRAS